MGKPSETLVSRIEAYSSKGYLMVHYEERGRRRMAYKQMTTQCFTHRLINLLIFAILNSKDFTNSLTKLIAKCFLPVSE